MIDKVLLIPGFCEPPLFLWPLKLALQRHCDDVQLWPDRLIFRDLEESVARLQRTLQEHQSGGAIALVTHSFGDWVARRAITASRSHQVSSLVSIAPVMQAGLVPDLLHHATGDVIPEVAVMGDPVRANCDADVDASVRRLVIWASMDLYVRPVEIDEHPNATVHHLIGSHLTVAMQPNSLRLISQFLFPASDIR
ncbi:hypothetical protein [Novipirellula caenicola]|uniref:Alpha/beta hydrolase family protein n=1 Tax=Novipirellula caenicola TaxID=1536901 RepID=A0ABP9VKS7_9BACT